MNQTRIIPTLSWAYISRCSAVAVCVPFLILALTGCGTAPTAKIPFKPGATVETLASVVTLSIKVPGNSTGGRGYMLYQRPDKFHLVMLTPFGTTAMESFVAGEHLTIMIPSKGEAYTGTFADIPADSSLRGWQMMRLMGAEKAFYDPLRRGETEKRIGALGEVTSYYDGSGLLKEEVFSGGEKVFFHDYRSVEGVPFPCITEYTDSSGASVRITFDQPEINGVLDKSALIPDLEGLIVLPLTRFKGI